MPIDPVTAVFNFLCTPVGQRIAANADAVLDGLIKDLIKLVHARTFVADVTKAS